MGSAASVMGRGLDETLHETTLSNGFWLSRYEVTQARWKAVTGAEPSSADGDTLPVEQVSWEDAQDFLILLNAASSGATYRLPTEAEWEYACRAGSTTRFPWGNDPMETEIDENAWYSANANETHPVGRKRPNAWGLYDMNGNVSEWCQDWYGAYPSGPVTDPVGSIAGTYRVIRGGDWGEAAVYCRSAARNNQSPSQKNGFLGLRLLRAPDDTKLTRRLLRYIGFASPFTMFAGAGID